MQLHIIKTWAIDEHPDKDAVYSWVRDNWYDLHQFASEEYIDSLKGFTDYFNCYLDYSIAPFGDRDEFITCKLPDDDNYGDGIRELSGNRLRTYLVNNISDKDLSGDCPFTGMCYDETLLDDIREFIAKPDSRNFQDLIDDCTHKFLSAYHDECEYIYSDEGLYDHLSANEYQFTESGECY